MNNANGWCCACFFTHMDIGKNIRKSKSKKAKLTVITPSLMMDFLLLMIMPTNFFDTLAGILTHWAQGLLRFFSFIHASD